MNKLHYIPDQLITHRGTMSLLDSIDDWGPDWIECSVLHRPDCSFSNADGSVPSWVGLEYMCQAVAALEGTQRLAKNIRISMGFVIGTKRLDAKVAFFSQNQRVSIRIDEEMKNTTSLGVYACKICDDTNTVLVEARIKAVMPEDPTPILSLKKGKSS